MFLLIIYLLSRAKTTTFPEPDLLLFISTTSPMAGLYFIQTSLLLSNQLTENMSSSERGGRALEFFSDFLVLVPSKDDRWKRRKEPEFPNYGKELNRNVDVMKQWRWVLSTGKYLHTCAHTHTLYMNQVRPHTNAQFFLSGVLKNQNSALSVPALLPKSIRKSSQTTNSIFKPRNWPFFKIFSVSSHWKSFLSMGLSVTETMISCYRLFATSSSERNSLTFSFLFPKHKEKLTLASHTCTSTVKTRLILGVSFEKRLKSNSKNQNKILL